MDHQERKEKEILDSARVIAIVGLSPDKEKASNIVARYLMEHGYRVIPVNPGYEEVLGLKSYKSVLEIPQHIDIVDIFMRSEKVMPVVREAISKRPLAVWLQLGIINEEAKSLVEAENISFFMDVCVKREHEKLFDSKQLKSQTPNIKSQ